MPGNFFCVDIDNGIYCSTLHDISIYTTRWLAHIFVAGRIAPAEQYNNTAQIRCGLVARAGRSHYSLSANADKAGDLGRLDGTFRQQHFIEMFKLILVEPRFS